MSFPFVRLSAVALSLSLFTGCAVAPDGSEERGATSSAVTIVPTGPVPTLSPMTLCANVTPAENQTTTVGSLQQILAGTSSATETCDYTVFDLKGTEGKGMNLILTDLEPAPEDGPVASLPLGAPYTSIPQASCASSYVGYQAYGLTPLEAREVGGEIVVTPAAWEPISEGTFYGTWETALGETVPACHFRALEPSVQAAHVEVSGVQPYVEVRVAAQAVALSAAGAVRGPLYLYVEPYSQP